MKIMPTYTNQQLKTNNQRIHPPSYKNNLSFNARNYNELIRESIALKVGGRFAIETFEELAEAAGTPCSIPKKIAKKIYQLKHNKIATPEISENSATTALSKNIIEIFKKDIKNFREVEPDLIYAGTKIPDKKTMKEFAKQRFKYVLDLDAFDNDPEYRELLSSIGIECSDHNTSCCVLTDYFKATIEKALKNKERVYFHCDWGTRRTDGYILAYNVIFKRTLPKGLVQDLDELGSSFAADVIEYLESHHPTYDNAKLQKIKNYLKNPNSLTKDLNLDTDI